MASMFQKPATSQSRPAVHEFRNTQAIARPCWPIVWLWVVSVAQYSFRYILQVNDPATSHLYGSTPAALSALKYEIFCVFALYSLFHLSRPSALISPGYRILLYVTFSAFLVLAAVFLVRFGLFPGSLDDTVLCALQFVPWMMSVFFVPFVFRPQHSLTRTLMTFERVMFWITFPFWVTTVVFVVFGIRYPALSYPGLLVRFGGILDDPNGYACLCLLLLVLSWSIRSGAWKFRALIYFVMLIGTLSFSGYISAVVMFLCLLPSWLRGTGSGRRFSLARISVATAVLVCCLTLAVSAYETDEAVDAISSLYSVKGTSTASHISNLLPDEVMMDGSSLPTLLLGVGGFSENFYWRILVNFGWTGLAAVIAVLLSWFYCAFWRAKYRHYSLGAWNVGVLLGSNGIAYLLTFPVSLIYWSLIALLVLANDFEEPLPRRT
jgi:hypothetical protein